MRTTRFIRSGFTLIEMIITLVIIGGMAAVIPRILLVSNRAMQLTIKEDGLYEAVSLTALIASLPWDQNTTNTDGKILDAGGIECNASTGYRIGGFVGSRNCIDAGSVPPSDTADGGCDDVDDFRDHACYSDATGGRIPYTLTTDITRHADTKRIRVQVSATGGKVGGEFNSSFIYDSHNLGQIPIQKRWW